MSTVINEQKGQGRIFISYSATRKAGMQLHDKPVCNALVTLIELYLERFHLQPTNVKKYIGDDLPADIVIDFLMENLDDVTKFKKIAKMLEEKEIGAKSIRVNVPSSLA